ncbi:hypothetical protein Naga_101169g2 [Nannochloropsis gaditana]|uniref:Uncharacterized protein n=1 Tax=Nannochloropsis gaditana TaxID=72520 RepID=W7THQ0_9STRA|nr:hypothetical protein Naga_101169g2 [Nannochloropsis gaditana]
MHRLNIILCTMMTSSSRVGHSLWHARSLRTSVLLSSKSTTVTDARRLQENVPIRLGGFAAFSTRNIKLLSRKIRRRGAGLPHQQRYGKALRATQSSQAEESSEGSNTNDLPSSIESMQPVSASSPQIGSCLPQNLISSTLLPLDLSTYRQLLSQAPSPSEALALLKEMHDGGLTVDPEALLCVMRLCAGHPDYFASTLHLHAQLLAFPSPSSLPSPLPPSSPSDDPPGVFPFSNFTLISKAFITSEEKPVDGPEKGQWENGCRGSRIPKVDADVTPVEGIATAAAIRESYGLALAACIYVGGRQGDGHARHLLWEMRAHGVAPNLVMYRELARTGLAVGEGGREGGEGWEEGEDWWGYADF